jgi:hypothetical protein
VIDYARITAAVEYLDKVTGGDVEPSEETDASIQATLEGWGFVEADLNQAIATIERRSAMELLAEIAAAVAKNDPAEGGQVTWDALRTTALTWLMVGFQLGRNGDA